MARPIGTLALRGRVERAVAFAGRDDIFLVFGHTSPWGSLPGEVGCDENNPPVPNPLADDVAEIAGYKKATTRLVAPDPDGNIRIYKTMWRVITPDEARLLKSPYVLVQAEFEDDELVGLTGYREVAVYSGVQRHPEIPAGRYALLPSEVAVPGVPEYFSNGKVIDRDGEADVYSLVLTF